ncbi:MAG: EAL domain-containing protein [Deltaproteobacteria bacterium]|nr:EAL domain-containing protein [Deltaproteobacteria bacterium]
MNFRLAVCPHDTQKGIKGWKIFSEVLSKKFNLEFTFLPFKDLKEEEKKLEKEEYHLVYANPVVSPLLHQKGYKPLAKFKGQKDIILLIGRSGAIKKGKEVIKVSAPILKHSLLGLLHVHDEFQNIQIDYTGGFLETFRKVKEGISDMGIIYKNTFEDIEEKDGIEVLEEVPLSISHIFMVHPALLDKIKYKFFELDDEVKKIFGNDGLETAGEGDIEPLIGLSARLDNMFKALQNKDIAKAILTAPSIAVFICRERTVYANNFAIRLTGYSLGELKNMGIEEFVANPDEQKKVKEMLQRRLNGEYFELVNNEIKFNKKDGGTFWALVFSSTIFFDGQHSGLVIFVDITKRKRLENLYAIIGEVNTLIKTPAFEEELFDKLCGILLDNMDLRFVWIGEPDKNGKTIKPVCSRGFEDEYLSKIKISLDPSVPEGMDPAAAALREGKIAINQDSRANQDSAPWKNERLKRGYLSSCAIPVEKDGKTAFVLNLYSLEPHFFEEENMEILEKLQKDLSFIIDKLSEIRQSIIISEALKNSDEWLMVTDENANVIFANNAVCDMSGYSIEELIGSNARIFKSGYQDKYIYRKLRKAMLSGKVFSGIFANRKKNGEVFYLQNKIIPVELSSAAKGFVSVGRNITEKMELTSKIEKAKFYDILTGLLNFNGFSFKVSEILKNTNKTYMLIIADIHNLTYINQVYGLTAGDDVLKRVGRLLKERFRDDDIVAKIGGDEFGIFLQTIKKKEDTFAIKDKLSGIFDKPAEIERKNISVSINAGVTVFPDDGIDFQTLYGHASTALSNAKKEGSAEIEFFNPAMEKKARNFVKIETLVEKAIKENLFVFYYQPYFNTQDLSLAGFESLARLKDKKGKIYSPAVFIDYLENSIYLKSFEELALENVLQKIKEWDADISLNISAKSFKRTVFMKNILDISSSCNNRLTIEITERVLMEDIEKTKYVLNQLITARRKCGKERMHKNPLKIAIDDFGTGYSSLFYLKDLPVNILKIDIPFIRDVTKGPKELALVETIIELTHKLGIKTVAEGVETREQLELLRKLGCDMVQGFLLAKPMPGEEVLKFLNR